MIRILAIESTCDETAAAVVADGHIVQSNVVATQFELHEKFRGVVPEIASRAHIENILPVIQEALAKADCTLKDVDAVAVAHRPGLVGSLLVGVTAAKTLAWSIGKPLIGVDHVQAHLYSVMLDGAGLSRDTGVPPVIGGAMISENQNQLKDQASGMGETPMSRLSFHPMPPTFPAVGLVVSGGHTALYRVDDWNEIELIGSTIDDAVGEAYDKVAAILDLGYPGGPVIDQLAGQGNAKAVRFPRTLLEKDSLDFSFSGLKTSVLYHVRGMPGQPKPAPSRQEVIDIAASFQAACVEVILKKIARAVAKMQARSVIVGGGVSANRGLRAALASLGLPVFVPPMQYCTDNAAMSGGLAHIHFLKGRFSSLDLDAVTYSQFRKQSKARSA